MSPQEGSMSRDTGRTTDSAFRSDTVGQEDSGVADSSNSGSGDFEGEDLTALEVLE